MSEDVANRCYRLVTVFIHRHADLIKGVFYGFITSPFVNSVFLIEMNIPDTLAPAEFLQFFNAVGEGGCGHERERNAQFRQFFRQRIGVVQHESNPCRRPIMLQPLSRSYDKAGLYRLLLLAGCGKSRVVGNAQVVSKPYELSH